MSKIFHGTVNGQSIEIEELLGIANGEQVEIVVKRVDREPSDWGAGIRRSAGAAAEIDEFDDVFQQIERERKSAHFREISE